MLIITPEISIEDKDITFGFIRASGPGGQNINKVSSAVQLRFDMRHSSSLPENVKKRLASLAGKKLADNGEIIIEAKRFRTQPKNREDAIKRLISLITKAAEKPKLRKKTKPSISASAARISNKKKRGAVKKIRSYNPDDWD
jgi:ribosome-associated protein